MCAAKIKQRENEFSDWKDKIIERMYLFWLAYRFSHALGTHKVPNTYTFFNFYFPIIIMEMKSLIISKRLYVKWNNGDDQASFLIKLKVTADLGSTVSILQCDY